MKLTPVTDPMDARLDTKANKVDVQNDLGDMVGLLAGWTADMRGGRNLLLNSDVNVTSSEYLAASLHLAPNHGLAAGDIVTISLKGQLGADRENFRLYNTGEGGADIIVGMTPSMQGDDGVYRATVPWILGSGGNTTVHVFSVASTSITESTIEWVKIERGNKSTPWTPAPEDAVAEIQSTGTTQSANPLLPIDHSLALRLDTMVGTRVFAGDIMIYGDTDWRDAREWFTPHLIFKDGRWANVKRNGSTVTLEVQAITGETQDSNITGDIPVGFRPPLRYGRSLGVADIENDDSVISVRNNNLTNRLILAASPPPGTRIAFTIIWETRDTWPTTLPGLPA